METKIAVTESALRELLTALNSDPHRIRELQATRRCSNNAITLLTNEYNQWVETTNKEETQ